MFRTLSAANFKSWRSLDDLQLAPVTGFFGTNSSGKTSLLQLLLLMKQTAASADRQQVLNLGGDERSPIALGLARDVLFKHDLDHVLSLGYSWELPADFRVTDPTTESTVLFSAKEVRFETELSVKNDQLYVNEFCYDLSGNEVRMSQSKAASVRRDPEYDLQANIGGDSNYLKRVVGRAWPLPQPHKSYGFPDETSAYFQNSGFVRDIQLELENQFGDRLFYLGPLRSYPKREYRWQGLRPVDVGQTGERSVEALLASRQRGRINTRKRDVRGHSIRRITVEEHVAAWLKELGLITDFRVDRISEEADLYRVWVRRGGSDVDVLLTDVGFGVSQILPVLVLLAYVPENSTVLLEQPEIHLHPAVQAGLADIILEAARTRRVQVIVESHSEHLLRRLQRREAEKKQEADLDQVALYFCDHVKGESNAERLEINDLGEITNWPDGFFGDPFGETAAIVKAGLKRRQRAS